MKRGYILVEGQTEEAFVKELLSPSLLPQLSLQPIVITTSRDRKGLKYRGGSTSFAKIKSQVHALLGDRAAAVVTTMIDLYALPEDFPQLAQAPNKAYERVEFLEAQFTASISDHRFVPFLMLHEFEALLLASPQHLQQRFPERSVERTTQTWLQNVESPEEINGGRDTHPSARLQDLVPEFRKTRDGPLIVQRVGLRKLRQSCPHLERRLTQLEALGEK